MATQNERPRASEAGAPRANAPRHSLLRALGLGVITGAADDDPSAIGTYATAGAKFGPSILWIAPVTLPMMFAVVYLSSKLGQVTGQGLFQVIRERYSRWLLYPALIGVLIGNTIEAGADIGGIAAAMQVILPVPAPVMIVATTALILALQVWGSYTFMRNIFRWLALALLAYVGSAVLARPDWMEVLKGTFVPKISFNREFLSLIVAIIGTSLSAYLYTWQSNQEVEEEIAMGRTSLEQRRGATERELRISRADTAIGMFFANLVMYFVLLSTASILYKTGNTDVNTAAEAAKALEPLAGPAAGLLFAIGVVGVGFLAVPIMTIGAAYDLCQSFGWPYSLHATQRQAPRFYAAIVVFTLIAMGMNFLGINPMKALVWAGIVQGFSTPPLMLLILLMTNNRELMGDHANGRAMRILGWITTIAIFAATIGLVVSWVI